MVGAFATLVLRYGPTNSRDPNDPPLKTLTSSWETAGTLGGLAGLVVAVGIVVWLQHAESVDGQRDVRGLRMPSQAGESRNLSELCLAAIYPEIPPDEVRRYWNHEDAPFLSEVIDRSPQLRIAAFDADASPDLLGPARRINDLFDLYEASSGDVLPRLDEAFAGKLLFAVTVRPGDPPRDVVSRGDVDSFIATHLGASLVRAREL